MRHYHFTVAALVSATLVFSCGQPDDLPAVSGSIPSVVSASLEDGASGVDVSLGQISVDYDVPVTIGDASAIELTGMDVEVSTANMQVRIAFGKLTGNTEYTLTLADGAVVSRSGNVPAAPLVLTFTTGEDPDAPPYIPGEPGDYSQSLVTENPLPAASRLYEYLLSIYGKNTLSGAMAHVDWNTDEAQWIGIQTGKYPAIAFFDYIHLPDSPSNWIDYGDITPVKEWWNAGGLVGIGWHWNVPVSSESSVMTFNTETKDSDGNTVVNTFSAADAVVDGTWENGVLKADLKEVAGYLMLLQDEGIPVIWRPLHEAAGNTYTYGTGAWFWWGADGAEAYKALWKYMFDYFESAGIRNLIWVWTTQTSSYSDADYAFYPGDEYVDIVGRDIYDNSDAGSIAGQFSAIAQMTTHKMVTLSELGNVADMASQWDAGAKWLFFMPWYDYDNDYTAGYAHQHADIAWWRSSFASPAVLDRQELPSDLFE